MREKEQVWKSPLMNEICHNERPSNASVLIGKDDLCSNATTWKASRCVLK